MSVYDRPFEPNEPTQNVAMDGTAKTITCAAARQSDRDSSVCLTVSGTQTVFVRLDGVTAATTTAMPLLAGTTQVFSMPVGSTTVKSIGTAGSTLYVTFGKGA